MLAPSQKIGFYDNLIFLLCEDSKFVNYLMAFSFLPNNWLSPELSEKLLFGEIKIILLSICPTLKMNMSYVLAFSLSRL